MIVFLRRLVERYQILHLLNAWRTAQAQLQTISRPLLWMRAAFFDDPSSESLGRLHIHRIIQRNESLQRCVRANAPQRANLAAGSVKRGHRGVGNRPPPEGVQAAAIAILSCACRPGALAVERSLPKSRWLRRVHGGSADLVTQKPAQGQGLVAYHLRFQPKTGTAGQQP